MPQPCVCDQLRIGEWPAISRQIEGTSQGFAVLQPGISHHHTAAADMPVQSGGDVHVLVRMPTDRAHRDRSLAFAGEVSGAAAG